MMLMRELTDEEVLEISYRDSVWTYDSHWEPQLDVLIFARALFEAARIQQPVEVPKCLVCGTTENLRQDGWYGYRCSCPDCAMF